LFDQLECGLVAYNRDRKQKRNGVLSQALE